MRTTWDEGTRKGRREELDSPALHPEDPLHRPQASRIFADSDANVTGLLAVATPSLPSKPTVFDIGAKKGRTTRSPDSTKPVNVSEATLAVSELRRPTAQRVDTT
jgi:hypothetical protein